MTGQLVDELATSDSSGPATTVPEPVRTGRKAWPTVFAVMFFSTWAGNQFSPLLLLYREKDHYSAVVVNGFLGVYVLGLIPAFLLSGALSDRYGRRPVMFVGVVAAVATSVALAFGQQGPLVICCGRLLAGIAVGTATCVGTSWLKELSQAPYDERADPGAGARRAALAFSLGSGAGALLAGGIAQWGPYPQVLPFLIHVVLVLPFAWLVLRTPETVTNHGVPGPLREQLRVPAAGHRRFTRVVVLGAPWIFAAAAIGYGYLPVLLSAATGGLGIAYATLLTGVALGISALSQPWAKRLDSTNSARGVLVSAMLATVGIVLVAGSSGWQSWPLGIVAAAVCGAGIGIGLSSGVLEVQRIAGPRDLAGLTGVFYAIAYSGFLLPTLLAAIAARTGGATVPLLAVAALGAVCSLLILRSSRRHLPFR